MVNSTFYSLREFSDYDSAYWGIGACSNGEVYLGLCSHRPGKSAGFFCFNTKSKAVKFLFDIHDAIGTTHGKIHTPILEHSDHKLYFGTHFAYPYGIPTERVEYEGGHLLSFDPLGQSVRDFGVAHPGEGILTLALSSNDLKCYLLTIPSGYLIEADIVSGRYRELGMVPSHGSICRTITTDDRGRVYGSYEDNGLFVFDPKSGQIVLRDNFFPEDRVDEWVSASRTGVNKIGRKLWRCVAYDEASDSLYGIYGSSRGFRIACQNLDLKMINPMLPVGYSSPSRVYPTLSMTYNDSNIFYTPADGMFDYSRSEHIHSVSHLMLMSKRTLQTQDLGELHDKDKKVHGVGGAVLASKHIYMLGAITPDQHRTNNNKLFMIGDMPFDLGLIEVDF